MVYRPWNTEIHIEVLVDEEKLGLVAVLALTLFALWVVPVMAAQGQITEVNPSGVTSTDNPDGEGNEGADNSDGAAEGANPAGVDLEPGEAPADPNPPGQTDQHTDTGGTTG